VVQVYNGISHSDSVTVVLSFYFYFWVVGWGKVLHIILVTLVMSLQVMYSGSQKDFLLEKSDCCLLPKNTFLR
jgi:hypothetical protein